MNQPLGDAVGNALEVREAIETLRGEGPDDFTRHCMTVAAHMLKMAGRGKQWTDLNKNQEQLAEMLNSGKGFDKLRLLVEVQGGDVAVIDNPDKLAKAPIIQVVQASESGYIAQVQADKIAMAALALGAGREKKTDSIDPAVGVVVHHNVGDSVTEGESIATIHASDATKAAEARKFIDEAFVYSRTKAEPLPLFYDVIE
jgi:pyrimidine-nucleoside phosphorylase